MDETNESQISRRRMLKRIGAGAAVAWTVPIMSSIGTPAFAASGACGCPPYDCTNPQTCPNGICGCAPHHGGGGCVCFLAGFCNVPGNGDICASDADCAQFGSTFVCADINPSGCLQCGGTTACLDTTGCGQHVHRNVRPSIKAVRGR